MKKAIVVILAVTLISLTGCMTAYSRRGVNSPYRNQPTVNVNHRNQPSTGDALQSVGELSYQLIGKRNGVTPQKYNNNMRALGALGTLMDHMGR